MALALLLLASAGLAQTPGPDSERGVMNSYAYRPSETRVPVWLDFSTGLDIIDCYDNSTIPFSYTGVGLDLNLGTTIEWGRCQLRPFGHLVLGSFLTVGGQNEVFDFSTEFLYRVKDLAHDRLHLWAGGYARAFVDLRSIPNLQNAATSLAIFGDFAASGMMSFDFAKSKAGDRYRWTTFLKMGLPLYARVNRPGYAYVGNPAPNMNVFQALFNSHENFNKLFPGANTELGLYYNMRNGNRLLFSYRWDYLSTGKKGTYRFDHAVHTLNTTFMFKLN